MTDSLSPEARALLDAARPGLSPSAAAVSRMRGRIAATSATGAAGSAIAIKLGLAGLVAAVAVGAAIYAGADRRGAEGRAGEPVVAVAAASSGGAAATSGGEAASSGGATASAAATATATKAATVAATSAAPSAAPTDAVDPALITLEPPTATGSAGRHAAAPSGRPTRLAEPAGRAAAPPRSAGVALAREVELVDLAMAALRRGESRVALAAARRHAQETLGRGQLAEDAAAIEIEAMCQLGDPAAAARRAVFDRRHPQSAQRARLDRACATDPSADRASTSGAP